MPVAGCRETQFLGSLLTPHPAPDFHYPLSPVAPACYGRALCVPAGAGDDLFAISSLSKIIRFAADEVPPKTGVVQGVNCISLRADEAVAVCVSPTSS